MATKTTEQKAASSAEADASAGDLASRDRDLLLRIYRAMVLTRAVEDRMVAMITFSGRSLHG